MALAFSPDGETVLTECLGQTTHRWDATTGLPIGPPMDHPGFYAIAFSPDRKTALTLKIDDSRTMSLWDLRRGDPSTSPWSLKLFRPCRVQPRSDPPVRIPTVQSADADTGLGRHHRSAPRRAPGIRAANRILAFGPDGETFLGVSDRHRADMDCRHRRVHRPPLRASGPRVERGIQPGWQDHPHRRRRWDGSALGPRERPAPRRAHATSG